MKISPVFGLAWVAACTVAPLNYSDFACPCPESHQCVCIGNADERCVPVGEEEMCEEPVPSCDGEFQIANIRRDWSTETVVAIAWDVTTGDSSLFGRYEAELSTEGESFTITQRTNPELGEYDLDLSGIVVERTWLRNLQPGTTYAVSLIAYDSSGGTCRLSGEFNTRPIDRHGALEIYGDGEDVRWRSPDQCALDSSADPFEGDVHLRTEITCDSTGSDFRECADGPPPNPASSCFYNVLVGMAYQEIPRGLISDFDEAFLEFTIRGEGEGLVSSDWSLTGFRTRRQEEEFIACRRCDEKNVSWRINGFTVPINAGYQTFQIPLSALTLGTRLRDTPRSGDAFTAADLETLDLFIVGGTWPHGMVFDVDSVRIRW